MGYAQVGSQPARGNFVTTFSENEGNGCPNTHQAAKVVLLWTQLFCFLRIKFLGISPCITRGGGRIKVDTLQHGRDMGFLCVISVINFGS